MSHPMMRILWIASALLAIAPICKAASPLAEGGQVTVAGHALMVGVAEPEANGQLECAASPVQHTIHRCQVPAALLPTVSCLGRRVASVTLNLHFQGQVQNMSIEFAADSTADGVLAQLKNNLAQEPKVQYWADDSHLFVSYIWVDGATEIELTKTVKGPNDGKARLYVSNLLGGLPLSPEDL